MCFIKDSFRQVWSIQKILVIFFWVINLNPRTVYGIHNLLHALLFHDCSFLGNGFDYNLHSFRKKGIVINEWNVLEKRGMYFVYINKNSLLPKQK